jgi:hypothetical protein
LGLRPKGSEESNFMSQHASEAIRQAVVPIEIPPLEFCRAVAGEVIAPWTGIAAMKWHEVGTAHRQERDSWALPTLLSFSLIADR